MYEIQDWGLVDYTEALRRQEELVQQVAETQIPGILVFCSHPQTVTLGRATREGDVTDFAGPVIEISRGGRATYHGPSQIVIYPIINLNLANHDRKPKDIHQFLRNFENAFVNVLKKYGIESHGKGAEAGPEETGVWVEGRKLVSFGIAVRKWVTFHGAALNFDHDPSAFKGLLPCGFAPSVMISFQELQKKNPSRLNFQLALTEELQKLI